jgi:nucleotide-binding universal stress UspA family protein
VEHHRVIIVAAVDGSEASAAVVEHAARHAEWMSADLHVLHVAHLTGLYYSALATALIDEKELESKLVDAVWEKVRPALDEIPDAVDVTLVGRNGYAGDTIADYASEVGADLIVMGSHGWGAVKSAVLGSTSHRVLQQAHCDVLVVRN